MLGAFIIVFREIIEAGIVIGIVMAMTRAVRQRLVYVGLGVLGGVVGASAVALGAQAISTALNGIGQEIFNAGVLILAALLLAGHNIWMAGRGRQMVIEAQSLGQSISQGSSSLFALTLVVGLTVLREGSEVALFLFGISASGGATSADLWIGALLGVVAGLLLSSLTYFGLSLIPNRLLFRVTNWLLAFLAAGLLAQSVEFLQQADLIDLGMKTAWNSSSILSDSSILGRILRALIGYTDQPSQLQVVVYFSALLAIVFLTYRARAADRDLLAN